MKVTSSLRPAREQEPAASSRPAFGEGLPLSAPLPAGVTISVVVPTCGRPGLLGRCLAALLGQSLAADQFEIIVVDDGACDETEALAARMADRGGPALRYLRTAGRRGPAAARNMGWRQARAALVAFTDDDCLPAPGWLAAGLAVLAAGADGASGRVIVPLPARPTDYERDCAGLGRSRFVTASCFYRRAALAAVGGFDERFRLAWREDSDLAFSLLERGCRLVEVPAAVVIHPVRPAAWGVSLAQQRKSLYNALLYKKHPERYRRELAPVTPWRYYLIVAALLAGLGGRRLGWLAWAALTAQFCAGRLRGTDRTPGHLAEMAVTSALIPPLAIFWRLAGALRYRVFFL